MRTQIESISIEVTSPMTMSINTVNLNKLTLMTGYNGSGKSFILINLWAVNYLAQCYVDNHTRDIVSTAQFIFSNSFNGINHTGLITGHFSDGSEIKITFLDGKVMNVDLTAFLSITEVPGINYQSSNMRLFNSMKAYLTIRKLSMKGHNLQGIGDAVILDLLSNYRLFEVISMESFINRLPIIVNNEVKAHLVKMKIMDDIVSLSLDSNEQDFIVKLSDNTTKSVTTYSAGDQSIINMILTNQ